MTTFTEQQGAEALKRCNFTHELTKEGQVVILNSVGQPANDEELTLLMSMLSTVFKEDNEKERVAVEIVVNTAREARLQRNLKKRRKS